MRTSLVTVHGKLDASKMSSLRCFSGPGQTPGTSSSLVFFDVLMRRGTAWRPRMAIRSFGPRRFISYRPVLRMLSAGNTPGPVSFNILSRVLAFTSSSKHLSWGNSPAIIWWSLTRSRRSIPTAIAHHGRSIRKGFLVASR